MLDRHELLALDRSKIIFLVDGNNIFPTSKHFKHYFISKSTEDKIEAQIRLRWFISMALGSEEVILFFDEKFDEECVKAVEAVIVPNKE
jgi:hypothetical protein